MLSLVRMQNASEILVQDGRSPMGILGVPITFGWADPIKCGEET